MSSGGEGPGQRVTKPGWRPCDEAPWTEGVLELLNDLVETSVEVKEELLEDQHLLRPCLDCLASPSEAAVESAMELLVTLSEDRGGEGQYSILEKAAEEASCMGFLMGHLNGPTSALRRCAADCLANLTSLPNFAHLLLESDLGAEPISSEFMQLLAARVADSAESPEVRQLACQTIVNLLHARPSGAVQTTAPELLVQCMPSDTGPEDAESAELAVLALLALSYTFPAQPSAVDIFVSSGVVPLVFSQLTPHIEGRAPDMQSTGCWRVGAPGSWGGDKGAFAAANAILGLLRQGKRKLLVHQHIRNCGGAKLLAETFQKVVKNESFSWTGLQSEVAKTLVQIFAEFCMDSDDESHRRMRFPALSVASLLPCTRCRSPVVAAASIYVLSAAYRSTPPTQFRDAKDRSQVSDYPSILFELWSGSIVRSEAARDKAMKGYKSQVRAVHDGEKARPCKTAYPSAPENRQLPRVMAQKRTHRHLFLKDLQTPPPNSGSAPKQETLTPRRRMTNVAEFQKTPAKESKKKLADAIRRKTFAAGTMHRAVRQSTVKNSRATITSRPKNIKSTADILPGKPAAIFEDAARKVRSSDLNDKVDHQAADLRGKLARLEKENRDLRAATKCDHEKIAFLEEQNTNLDQASKVSSRQRDALRTKNEALNEEITRIKANGGSGAAARSRSSEGTSAANSQGLEQPMLQRQAQHSSAVEIRNRLLAKHQSEQAEIENLLEGQLGLPLQERERLLKKRCAELMHGWADAVGRLAEQIDAIESSL